VAATPQSSDDGWRRAASDAGSETILLLERKRRSGFGGEIPTLAEAEAAVQKAASFATSVSTNKGGYGMEAAMHQSVAGPQLMLRLIKAERWLADAPAREAAQAAAEAAEAEARRLAHEEWEAKRAAAPAPRRQVVEDDLPL